MTGFNETASDEAIEQVIGGGADVRLMTTDVDYDDTSGDLDTKEVDGDGYEAQTVDETDWTVSHDATEEEATLQNDAEVDFGTAGDDWGTVVDVVIDGGDDGFIITDEESDPEITEGEQVSIDPEGITYTLG